LETLVSIKQITKQYQRGTERVDVLRDLSLELGKGEFVAIMGPSGSGKSTLLNLIAGLDAPSTGHVEVAGQRIEQLSESALTRWRASNVGFVFQSCHLLPAFTAAENIEVPLLLTSLSAARRQQQVRTALELVGLSERAHHKPAQLSGGQQQRVAIARAIVSDPILLVCDEPTGNLDRASADDILTLLKSLNVRSHKTIVMVTHDPKAAEYATRTVVLDKGALMTRATAVAA